MNEEAAKLSAKTGLIIDQFMATDLYEPSQDDVTISYIMQRIVEVTGKDYTDLDTIKYLQYTVLCNMLSDYARAATFTSQLQMRWYEAYQRLRAASAESAPYCLCGAVYAVKNRGSPQRRLRTAA